MLETFDNERVSHGIEHFEDVIENERSLCIIMDYYINKDVQFYLSTRYESMRDAPVALRQKIML